MRLIDYANPTRFLGLVAAVLPWIAALTALTFAVGLWLVFFVAPADYQQGETVKIMYIHVPFSWLSMFCYMTMAASAFGTLVWRHPLADVSAKCAAPDRRRLHFPGARHRVAVGQADVGGRGGCGTPA